MSQSQHVVDHAFAQETNRRHLHALQMWKKDRQGASKSWQLWPKPKTRARKKCVAAIRAMDSFGLSVERLEPSLSVEDRVLLRKCLVQEKCAETMGNA